MVVVVAVINGKKLAQINHDTRSRTIPIELDLDTCYTMKAQMVGGDDAVLFVLLRNLNDELGARMRSSEDPWDVVR